MSPGLVFNEPFQDSVFPAIPEFRENVESNGSIRGGEWIPKIQYPLLNRNLVVGIQRGALAEMVCLKSNSEAQDKRFLLDRRHQKNRTF